MKRLLVAVLLTMLAVVPAFAERRWLVQTSDNKIIGVTDDDDVEAPDPSFATLVLDSVIRMADPPGATGVILAGGIWNGTTYTPPANLIPEVDPSTDQGSVQVAAHAMMDVFDAALAFIHDNRSAWTEDARAKAEDRHLLADCQLRTCRAEQHPHSRPTLEVHGRVGKLAGRRERRRRAVCGRNGRRRRSHPNEGLVLGEPGDGSVCDGCLWTLRKWDS